MVFEGETVERIIARLAGGNTIDNLAAQVIIRCSESNAIGVKPEEAAPDEPVAQLAGAMNAAAARDLEAIGEGARKFTELAMLRLAESDRGSVEYIVTMRDAYEVLRIAMVAALSIAELEQ